MAKLIFLLAIPLLEEFRPIAEAFPSSQREKVGAGTVIHTYEATEFTLKYFCMAGMGNPSAASISLPVIQSVKPDVVITFGLGGSLDPSLDNGGVGIASSIVYYEPSKVTEEVEELRPESQVTDLLLLNSARELSKEFSFPVITGSFLVGEKVIASNRSKQRILAASKKAIVVEMESHGVLLALQNSGHMSRFISIRCISDQADANKNDEMRSVALENGLSFLKSFLNLVAQNSGTVGPLAGNFLAIEHLSQERRTSLLSDEDLLHGLKRYRMSVLRLIKPHFLRMAKC